MLLNEAQPLTESAVESLQQPKKGTQKSVYTDAQAAKLAPQKLFLRISSLQSDEWTQIKEVLCTQPGVRRSISTRWTRRKRRSLPAGTGANRILHF